MSSCRDMRRRALKRLDGSLAFEEELLLERHLESCARCRAHAARAARLEEALARLPEPAGERLDVERAVRAVRERVGAEAPRRRPRRFALAAAALVALGTTVALALAARERRDDRGTISLPDSTSRSEHDQPGPGGFPPESSAGRERSAEDERLEPAARDALASGRPGAEGPESLLDSSSGGETLTRTEARPEAAEPGAAIDAERLARAREQVRVLLLECAGDLDPRASRADAERFAERFERLSHRLRVLGWPRERLVASLLDGDDARAARAAARYLGVRGGALAARALEAALARDHRKRSAARALADAGEAGLEGLARAARDPELRWLALRGIARVGGVAAAATLERELRREPREDALAALAALGPDASVAREGASVLPVEAGAWRTPRPIWWTASFPPSPCASGSSPSLGDCVSSSHTTPSSAAR